MKDTARIEAMAAFMALVQYEYNMYEEGLSTDLEMMRKIYLECHTTYGALDCCTECGAGNEGDHKEEYGGNFCPDCNPDKKRYTVTTMTYPTPRVVTCLTHKLWAQDGIFSQDVPRLEKMELMETAAISHEDIPRVLVTRIC
jgi:hypothetical protein